MIFMNTTIKDVLEREIQKWDLDENITSITTDNGSNMVLGLRLLKNSLGIERTSCTAHTLQLCIKKAWQDQSSGSKSKETFIIF